MKWPSPLLNSSPFGSWMNQLLNAAKSSELISVVGGRLNKSPTGTTLIIDNPLTGASKWPPVLYDPSKSYSVGDWVWVSPSSSAVTAGIRDITTGLITQATAGLYRAQFSIAPGTVTVSGTPVTAYYIPQLPEPNTDDITATNVKWIYFRGVASC